MTKEEVLQRANEYCSERSYDDSTLTSDFKEKFADFFAKKYPDAPIDDESALADMKFNLDTAKSASSNGRASLQKSFEAKENGYKAQIAELNKKIGKKEEQKPFEIPKELQDKIDRLEAFESKAAKEKKFAAILDIAKKGVREDLHGSFAKFVQDYDVDLEKEDKEQAEKWVSRFTEVFKDSIGDIKPLKPQQVRKMDEEFFASLPKVKVV